MTSFHGNNFGRCHLKSTSYNDYRYPSYLLKVVPPEVYSCDDIRSMLVPKTYGTRNASNVVTNHSHSDVSSAKSLAELKNAESTKRSLNEVKTPYKTTNGHKKRNNASECKAGDVPLSRLDSVGKQLIANNANTNNGKSNYDGQVSHGAIKIHKPFVIDETKNGKKCHTSPEDSGYVSKSNSSVLVSKISNTKEICPQIYDEQDEHCVFYDYDDPEETQNVIKKTSAQRFSDIYGTNAMQFVEICKNCNQSWPVDDFEWEKLSETDKSHFIDIIDDETNILETNNYFYDGPGSP